MESLQSKNQSGSRSSLNKSAIDNFQNFSTSVSTRSKDKLHNFQQSGIGSFVQKLNPNQYQQLMSMMSTHLASSSNTAIPDDQGNKSYNADVPGAPGLVAYQALCLESMYPPLIFKMDP